MKEDERIIKIMPDKETLQEFVNGMHRPSGVCFNIEKGEFEWIVPREDLRTGEPKTEEGWRLRGL